MSFADNTLAGMLRSVAKRGSAAIAKNLRELRAAKEWTQDALEPFGFAQNTISKYETGSIMPSPPALLRLARAYGVPVASILRGVDHEYDHQHEVTQADRPVVVKHPPSPERGGVQNAPARTEARVLELEAKLADVTKLLDYLINTARSATSDMERARARLQGKTTARRKA
jgi:transcriptional regulator with XRE-family HTH domain